MAFDCSESFLLNIFRKENVDIKIMMSNWAVLLGALIVFIVVLLLSRNKENYGGWKKGGWGRRHRRGGWGRGWGRGWRWSYPYYNLVYYPYYQQPACNLKCAKECCDGYENCSDTEYRCCEDGLCKCCEK